MDVVRGHFKEERLVLVLLDEGTTLRGDDRGDVLVVPQRGLAADLLADARNALDERVAVAALDAVIELDRIGRIEIRDAMILHPHAWNTVAGGGDDPGIIKADFQRAGFDLAVVIGRLRPGQDAICRRCRSVYPARFRSEAPWCVPV